MVPRVFKKKKRSNRVSSLLNGPLMYGRDWRVHILTTNDEMRNLFLFGRILKCGEKQIDRNPNKVMSVIHRRAVEHLFAIA